MYIYILNKDGAPLMPTKRKAHVQKLLRHGKAAIVNKQPYTVRLKYQSPGICQSLYGGQDPGRTNIGAAVLTEKGECVYRSKLETRNKEISKLMTERRQHRQASRRGERLARKRIAKKLGTTTDRWLNRKLPGYGDGVVRVKDIINTQARFNNRTRPEGWLTPTARQLVQTHLSEIRLIRKILPVDHWTLEVNRFAFMLMDDERLSVHRGVRVCQTGRKVRLLQRKDRTLPPPRAEEQGRI